ncbi:hypothetical protein AgCh_033383 [Apium graveolens]
MLVIPSPEISQGELLREADAAPAGPEADAVFEEDEDIETWLDRIKSKDGKKEGKKKFQSPFISDLNKIINLPSKGRRFRPGQPELDLAYLFLLNFLKKKILKLLCSKELRSSIKVSKGQWEAALEKLLEGKGPYDWLAAGKAPGRERKGCPFFRRLVDEVERMKLCQKRKKGITTVMSLLDSPVELRENSIQFSMETEFCELSPKLGEHFKIFEDIRGFNATIVTSANTQDETLPLWSGLLQKEEGENPDLYSEMRDKHRYKLSKLPRKSSFARDFVSPSEAVSARLFRISTAPRLRLPPQPAEDVYYEKEPDRRKAILERKKAEKDDSAASNRKAPRSSLK